jgi:voltage-gated potassium channel
MSMLAKLVDFFHRIGDMVADNSAKLLSSSAISILAIGTIFYHRIEGWSWLNSLYFSVTTLTTVGFGDMHPTTDISKIFTMFYLIIGVGILLSFINRVAVQAKRLRNANKKLIEQINSAIKK